MFLSLFLSLGSGYPHASNTLFFSLCALKILNEYVAKVIKAKPNMEVSIILTLQNALLNFAVKVPPSLFLPSILHPSSLLAVFAHLFLACW